MTRVFDQLVRLDSNEKERQWKTTDLVIFWGECFKLWRSVHLSDHEHTSLSKNKLLPLILRGLLKHNNKLGM